MPSFSSKIKMYNIVKFCQQEKERAGFGYYCFFLLIFIYQWFAEFKKS
jgi:hypothetical protein